MMMLLQLGHMTNVYGFISTGVNLITSKLDRMETSIQWFYLAKMMASPQPSHVTNNCDFISISVSLVTTKIDRMVDQRRLLLEMMTIPKLGQVTNFYGFVSTSVNPIRTKFGRKVDQHALILPWKSSKLDHQNNFHFHKLYKIVLYLKDYEKSSHKKKTLKCFQKHL